MKAVVLGQGDYIEVAEVPEQFRDAHAAPTEIR